jgi:hypothetical protein
MQVQLGVGSPAAPPFYSLLASYYASPRGSVSAQAVLFLLQVGAWRVSGWVGGVGRQGFWQRQGRFVYDTSVASVLLCTHACMVHIHGSGYVGLRQVKHRLLPAVVGCLLPGPVT